MKISQHILFRHFFQSVNIVFEIQAICLLSIELLTLNIFFNSNLIFRSFDCPDFTKYDENKCFWKGKPYNLHEKPNENIALAPGQLALYNDPSWSIDTAIEIRYFSKDEGIGFKYIGDSGDYWDYNSVQWKDLLPMRSLYKTKESKAEYKDYDYSIEEGNDYAISYSCYEIGCACGKRGVFGCFRPIECNTLCKF